MHQRGDESVADVLAVIPARAGSKGLPGKNILPLLGKPLIAYTIEAALAAHSLGRVIVSTDGDDIANIARSAGADVIMRPAEFATDTSTTEEALLHVLDTLRAEGSPEPEFVVTLEPTSPLRTAATIDRCVMKAREHDASSVMTVLPDTSNFGRLDGDLFVPLDPDAPRRRQLRPPLYAEASVVWVTRTTTLRERRSVLAERIYAVTVDATEAIDINTGLDFAIAESALRDQQEGH